jgi:hypothetical protein
VGESAHVTVAVLASDATPEEAKAYRDQAIKYMGKARSEAFGRGGRFATRRPREFKPGLESDVTVPTLGSAQLESVSSRSRRFSEVPGGSVFGEFAIGSSRGESSLHRTAAKRNGWRKEIP